MITQQSSLVKILGLLLCAVIMLACFFCSMMFGATNYSMQLSWDTVTQYDDTITEQMIIRTTRVPRAFIAAAIGASLAIAGVLMQALTHNPLASPSVLGINAAATFFVVVAAVALQIHSMSLLMWLAFLGAVVGAISVYALGSIGRDGLTPLKIILAGAAITALFSSVTQALLVLNNQGLNTVLFWLTGSIAGRSPDMLVTVLPYLIGCWLVACLLGRDMNVLMMGEDTAKGLGQRTLAIKLLTGLIVVILAGSAVSVAGPIGFIGVVIPHLTRYLIGTDHRWVIPYSALLGAILLLAADVIARYPIIPQEIPVGVMTALVGTPFFIYIARRGLVKS